MFGELYAGASEPSWLSRSEVPLFIPYHRLMRRWGGKLPKSPRHGRWALDSGGFEHVRKNGGWVLEPETYVRHTLAFDRQIGNMAWAAPMDWMCEQDALAATGLTVREHQALTVANLPVLERIWYDQTDDESPFALVLQGDPELPEDAMVASFMECWDMYVAAGIDPAERTFIGVGSVCKQKNTEKIGALLEAIRERGDREGYEHLAVHLFGAASAAIVKYSHLFTSCDSQSWSRWARWDRIKWDGCTADHADCRNCLAWAQAWRAQTLANAGQRDDYDDRGLLQYPWWPRREWPDAA